MEREGENGDDREEGKGGGEEGGRGEGGKRLEERVKENDPGILKENGSLREGDGRQGESR